MQNCGLSPSSAEIEQICKQPSQEYASMSSSTSLLTRSSLTSPGSFENHIILNILHVGRSSQLYGENSYFICFAVLETDSNDSLSNVSLQMSSSSMSSMSLLSDQLQKHLLSSTLVTNSGQVKKSNFNLNQTHSECLGDKISIRWSYKSHKYLDNSSSHPGTHSIPFTIHQHQRSRFYSCSHRPKGHGYIAWIQSATILRLK